MSLLIRLAGLLSLFTMEINLFHLFN